MNTVFRSTYIEEIDNRTYWLSGIVLTSQIQKGETYDFVDLRTCEHHSIKIEEIHALIYGLTASIDKAQLGENVKLKISLNKISTINMNEILYEDGYVLLLIQNLDVEEDIRCLNNNARIIHELPFFLHVSLYNIIMKEAEESLDPRIFTQQEIRPGLSSKDILEDEMLTFFMRAAHYLNTVSQRECDYINVLTGRSLDINKINEVEEYFSDDEYFSDTPSFFKDLVQFQIKNNIPHKEGFSDYILDLLKEHSENLIQLRTDKYCSRIENFVSDIEWYQTVEYGEEFDAYINKSIDVNKDEIPVLNSKEELDSLVGLSELKKDVISLINFIKIQKEREKNGLKAVPLSLHLVFTGNPGTGKTTVARILAKLYREIGILSQGQLIEVDRSGLVAGYVGQTALKTQEKIEMAKGGILFIDEAYTLAKGDNDFGQEAIDTILKAMEDNREDFVVIVAGYPDLMHKFINSNPGLKSRFNKFLNFPDYNAYEMKEIFNSFCAKYDYELDERTNSLITQLFEYIEKNKSDNFSNARDVRNVFEKIIGIQASRVAGLSSASDKDMMMITMEDVLPVMPVRFTYII